MKKDKFKKNIGSKGFAIAVVLGVAAISIASIAAYTQTVNKLTPTNADPQSSQNTWVFTAETSEESVPTANSQSNVPLETDDATADDPSDADTSDTSNNTSSSDSSDTSVMANDPETESAEEVNKPIVSTSRNIMPVEGEVSHPFSNNELVKSETLGVWKTHDGCDILCELGTQVKSMSDGVVKEIKEDPLWGVYVITEQTNGLEVHYCGLAKELEVKVGQELKEGQVIGVTSDTCQIEIVQQPHLHLGVKQNDKWIDPMSVIEQPAE